MIIGIMQPYFFPYLGYFQLIDCVDRMVIYDNIEFTKRGWINRNRMLSNGKPKTFTIPLRKDSDFLNVSEREISPEFRPEKLLSQLFNAYRHAPCFRQTFAFIEKILMHEDRNLFRYIFRSIVETVERLGLESEILVSSKLDIDHALKGQERVLAICKHLNAESYINPGGGKDLYSKKYFAQNDITLRFMHSKSDTYQQFGDGFVPDLSIIDVMMFNPVEKIRTSLLRKFTLV